MITLEGLTLPRGLKWDSLGYCAIKQKGKDSLTGRHILQRGRMAEGRPITLVGNEQTTWLLRHEGDSLSALRLIDRPLNLVYHGQTFKVRFDLGSDDHFVIKALWGEALSSDPNEQCYVEQIKLIEVIE